jgi:FlaG/FlaF family flagellin (archaellin)
MLWFSLFAAFVVIRVWENRNRDREMNRRVANMLMIFIAFILLGTLATTARGQTTSHEFKDTSGRSMGRSVTDTKGNTTFYNSLGQNTGRSNTQNGITTIYNERGQQTGTIRNERR